MINASELRIGNLVNVPHGDVKIDKFVDLGVHFTDGCGGTFNSLEPIPLTEEWLKKFGFDSKDPFLFSNSDYDSFYLSDTKIKYVHQLQNLYFALTGKELEMK